MDFPGGSSVFAWPCPDYQISQSLGKRFAGTQDEPQRVNRMYPKGSTVTHLMSAMPSAFSCSTAAARFTRRISGVVASSSFPNSASVYNRKVLPGASRPAHAQALN